MIHRFVPQKRRSEVLSATVAGSMKFPGNKLTWIISQCFMGVIMMCLSSFFSAALGQFSHTHAPQASHLGPFFK